MGVAESEAPMAERVGDDRSGSNEVEMAVGLVMPTQVYPLFENALRAASPDGPRPRREGRRDVVALQRGRPTPTRTRGRPR